jgi:hypothetical protein
MCGNAWYVHEPGTPQWQVPAGKKAPAVPLAGLHLAGLFTGLNEAFPGKSVTVLPTVLPRESVCCSRGRKPPGCSRTSMQALLTDGDADLHVYGCNPPGRLPTMGSASLLRDVVIAQKCMLTSPSPDTPPAFHLVSGTTCWQQLVFAIQTHSELRRCELGAANTPRVPTRRKHRVRQSNYLVARTHAASWFQAQQRIAQPGASAKADPSLDQVEGPVRSRQPTVRQDDKTIGLTGRLRCCDSAVLPCWTRLGAK